MIQQVPNCSLGGDDTIAGKLIQPLEPLTPQLVMAMLVSGGQEHLEHTIL